jgi:hypothetical protein
MAAFVIWAALHYQIIILPTFRPSLELIRDHEIVSVVNAPKNGELQPDGAELQWKWRFK